MKVSSEYQPNGWLTKTSVQYGSQHRQPKDNVWDIRLRSHLPRQYLVEVVRNGTEDDVVTRHEFFDLARARTKFVELLGKKPAKILSPEHKKEIIL